MKIHLQDYLHHYCDVHFPLSLVCVVPDANILVFVCVLRWALRLGLRADGLRADGRALFPDATQLCLEPCEVRQHSQKSDQFTIKLSLFYDKLV